MKPLFELEWFGGAAEGHFRKVRPEVRELPWGTLRLERYPPLLLDAARIHWTRMVVGEYRAAVAMSHLLQSLLEARAPLDVIGMASDFIADEVSHVEIASRLTMELGGAAPIHVDAEALAPLASNGPTALERAHEEVLRLSCIHEVLSRALVTDTLRAATHPLVLAAEGIIARDEAMHVRFGAVYFEWASRSLEDAQRARLAEVATAELKELSPLWLGPELPSSREPFTPEQANELGWLDREAHRARVVRAIREEIVPTLLRAGIAIAPQALEDVLCGPADR